ncbi:MAG: hypothetical protein ABI165_07955 [Bryobacteraceae bacterium]
MQLARQGGRKQLMWCWLALAPMGLPGANFPAAYTIQTVAGGDNVGDGGPAAAALFGQLEGVAVDAKGDIFLSDAVGNRVRKITPDGVIRTLAGTGTAGFSGDGGPATQADLNAPYGIAADGAGNLYIADLGNARVRMVAPDGTIRTIAGGGSIPPGGDGDGGPASSAKLVSPRNVAVDGAGNLYISDFDGQRVYEVSAGTLTTVAGTGKSGLSGDGGAASLAQISYPAGLAVDSQGALYIADSNNHRIRRAYRGQIVTLGLTTPGTGPSLAPRTPTGLSFDGAGNLWISDAAGGQIYRMNPLGAVTAIAAPAQDVAADAAGNVYAASGGHLEKITPAGTPSVIAGTGAYAFAGDGGPALNARLNLPGAVALDAAGNLYIADTSNHRIRKVSTAGVIMTVAGTGVAAYGGDGAPATLAPLNSPGSVAVDAAGNLYIADTGNHRLREVTAAGVMLTVAGTGVAGYNGDGGLASAAQVNAPKYVTADGAGNVYFADTGNQRVRKIAPGGVIFTVAGTGLRGFSGDGGAAISASLDTPLGLALDRAGNLYIADSGNRRVRVVSTVGAISTLGGAGVLGSPRGVAVSAAGDVFVADAATNQIIHMDTADNWSVAAGDGSAAFGGDGGAASSAQLDAPSDIAIDAAGDLYVADAANNRIRELTPGAVVAAPLVAPLVSSGLTIVNAASQLPGPVAPGEVLSILGAAIGPPTAAGAQFAAPGVLANQIGDTQVLFNGSPAALYYAQASQINVQAPYEIAGLASVDVQVIYKGALAGRATLIVTAVSPALFTLAQGTGQVAALNEDGTYNSVGNPAVRGSVVTIFATGEGQTNPSGADGVLAGNPDPAPLAPVLLRVGNYPADILFAQEAPEQAGLLQINARLPGGYFAGGVLPLVLQVGGGVSQPGVTIAVQ